MKTIIKVKDREELIKAIKEEIEKQGKVKLDLNHIDVSEIEDFNSLFSHPSFDLLGADLEELNVSSWNTGKATNMYDLFGGCNLLEKLDLSAWDVSNVTDMSCMFLECWFLGSAGISGWNTSKVTDMGSMFEGCTLLNEDLSAWDVSEVRNVYCMFSGCESFNTDLSSWITWDEETLDDLGAFEDCPDYRSMFNVDLEDLEDDYEENMEEDWDDDYDEEDDPEEEEDVIPESDPRYDPRYLKPKTKKELISIIKREVNKQPGDRIDLNHIDVSEISDMSELFYERAFQSVEEIVIDKWDVSNVERMEYMFYGCLKFNADLSSWNVSNVKNMSNMFYECKKFISDISAWDVSKVTDFTNMFSGCKSFKSDLSAWKVSDTASIDEFLSWCTGFDRLKSPKKSRNPKKPGTIEELREIVKYELDIQGPNADLNHIDTSEITELTGLFYLSVENIKIDKWDTSKVTDMSGLFNGCGKFNCDLSGWDVSKVTRMAFMFFSCQEFTSDISAWDVSSVTDMSYMFNGCLKFNSDLSGWNVSKVKDMSGMFYRCKSFNSDLSKWDISSVTEISQMLCGCDSFTYSIKNWKLGKLGETEIENLIFGRDRCTYEITEREEPVEEVVRGRRSIGPYYVIDRVKKIKVTSKEELREQIKIAIDKQGPNVDLEHLDVSEITDMSELFVGLSLYVCWIGVFSWDVSKVTNMKAMFKGCNCLYLCPNSLMYWDISNVTDMSEMFSGCTNVKVPIHKYWKIDENMVNVDKMFENSGVQ